MYNQNTLYLIAKCDVAMVTDSHLEYANQVVTFSKFCLKLVKTAIHVYNIISIHIKYI